MKKPRHEPEPIRKKEYKKTLRALQIELVKLQKHFIKQKDKILVLFEGRDAAGKDGTIKRIVLHLSPRETRVVALGVPSDRERGSWYFQRFVPHLPAPQELVLFNRSWYNRAGVERVMGYCNDEEYDEFIEMVPRFEEMLIRSGINFLKYYLDITRGEQKRRLRARREDPLKQWKDSPIDDSALRRWNQYSQARDQMLARTHTALAPWTIARADNKRLARLNVIRDILTRLEYGGKDESLLRVNREVVFPFDESSVRRGMLAR